MKKNRKKILKNHLILLGVSILLVAFFSLMDVVGSIFWKKASGGVPWGEAYQLAQSGYMVQFWSFAYGMIFLVAGVSYLWRRDWSESLALIITPWLLLKAGFEDLVFYLIKGLPFLYEKMPWLEGYNTNTLVAKIFGFETTTGIVILISLAITVVVLVILNIILFQLKPRKN